MAWARKGSFLNTGLGEMSMAVFKVSGVFRKPLRETSFSMEVEAPSEKIALEKAYSLIGSRHRVRRENIKILSLEKVKPETR
jgi:large subunit ribosomal protein LX